MQCCFRSVYIPFIYQEWRRSLGHSLSNVKLSVPSWDYSSFKHNYIQTVRCLNPQIHINWIVSLISSTRILLYGFGTIFNRYFSYKKQRQSKGLGDLSHNNGCFCSFVCSIGALVPLTLQKKNPLRLYYRNIR